MKKIIIFSVLFILIAALIFCVWWVFIAKKNILWFGSSDKPKGIVSFKLEATSSDSAGISPETSFILKSNKSISEGVIKNILKFSPEVDFSVKKSAKPFSIISTVFAEDSNAGGETSFEIKPNQPLEEDKVYSAIIVDPEVADREYSWAFQVKAPFQVVQTLPRDKGTSVPTNSGIEITFNREGLINAKNYFEISPKTDGFFEERGDTLVFAPKKLLEKTIYTVTIKKGLKINGSEEALDGDYVFVFETGEKEYTGQKPYFDFSNDFLEFVPERKPVISVFYYGLDPKLLDITVYKFSGADEFISAYQESKKWNYTWSRFLQNEGSFFKPKESQKIFSFKPAVVEVNYSNFFEMPQILENGYYVLDIITEGKHKQAFLQITPVSHYFSVTQEKSFLWIYDFSTKNPIAEISASYFDSKSGTSSLGKTDKDGLVNFSTPAALKQENTDDFLPKFFKVEKNGYSSVFIKVGDRSRYLQKAEKGDSYWDFLSTDRTVYQISDTLRYWGVIKGRNEDLRQKKVSVGLFSGSNYCFDCVGRYAEETPLVGQEILVSQFDTIQGEMQFRGASPGYYTLKVKIGNDIISTTNVQILSYSKPAYQIIVTPSKNAIFAGEKVDFNIRAEFFDGTPVSDLKLRHNGHWGSKSIEGELSLDTNGEGVFSYTPEYSENKENNSSYWPNSLWVSFMPKLSEEGEISASGQVLVFGPRIYLQTFQEKEDDGTKITAKLNRVVINNSKEESVDNYYNQTEYIGDAVLNYSLSAKIIKETTIKVEGADYYDSINKVVRKSYNYETKTAVVEELSGVTDGKGEWSFVKNFPGEEGVVYKVIFGGEDEGGRKLESTSYIYASSVYEDQRKFIASLQLSEKNEEIGKGQEYQFSIGEDVSLELKIEKGEKPVSPKVLFYRYQNNIDRVSIQNGYSFKENFRQEFLPSASYRGVIFGPDGFEETESVVVSFKEDDRKLTIDINPEKDKYRPGEEIKADLSVKNKKDKGVSADVNVAVVDEALFHILSYDLQSKISDVFYRNIYVYPITGASQYSASNNAASGGAEKGGCFSAGTQILMGDGTKKPIEKINVGDAILTLNNEQNKSLSPAIVQGISKHNVDEYLVINKELRVTPEHKIYINNKWDYAGNIKIGDTLIGEDGSQKKIFSVERKKEKDFPVYNIVVGKYHTYFAGGYFVHNAEKGGTARTNFLDVVLFQTVKSDKDGKASIKFTAPDNITSWRTTAIAFSPETMEVGQSVKLIKTSLPFFVDVTMSNYYLLEDKPIVRLRAFGTDYKKSDPVEFGAKSESLKIDKKESARDNNASSISLGNLSEGEHEIIFSAKQGSLQDSILRKINVVKSYFRKSESSNYQLSDSLSGIEGNKDGFTELLFMDAGKGRFYSGLQNRSFIDGIRVDQEAASFYSKKFLSEYFDKVPYEGNLDLSGYHAPDGGISLLPYSDSDLELSAKIADLAPDFVFQSQLKTYFKNSLKDKKSDIHRIAKALYGLASLKEPVLVKINLVKDNKDLIFEDKVYIALALSKIGDKEEARKIYENDIKNKLRFQGSEAWLNEEKDATKTVKLSGMIGVLCSYLNDETGADSVWNYISTHDPEKDLDVLEEELLMKSELAKPISDKAKFSFKAGLKADSVSIEKGAVYKAIFSKEELNSIKFSNIEGKITVVSFYERSKNPEELQKNSELSLTRQYLVNGKSESSFEEGDVVIVRLDPNIVQSAIDGSYQVIDYLPSGLRPITRVYEKGLLGGSECDPIWYPAKIIDNSVYFNIYKGFDKTEHCSNRTLNYYARVVSKGSYKVNPAIIQSLKDLNSLNLSPSGSIEIK